MRPISLDRCGLLALLGALVPCATALAAPQDAPGPTETPERGLRLRKESAFDGLTLVYPINSLFTYLVDMDGEVVHQWESELAPGGANYFLENGNLLRCARLEDSPRFRGGGIAGRIEEIDWDGKVVWAYELAGEERTQHHDIELLPNGNLLMIAWEYRSREEVLARGRDPGATVESGLWPDAVLELERTPDGGEIVWEWHSWDHLIQDRDPEKPGYGSIPDNPGRIDINGDHRDKPPLSAEERERIEEMEREMRRLGYAGGDEEEEDDGGGGDGRGQDPDWLHTNAVSYHPGLDLIVLSTPKMCELWVIDHSTTSEEAAGSTGGRWGHGGDLLYRWGNPRNYGAGDDDDQALFYQHDPTWVTDAPKSELRLLVFNNGGGRPGGPEGTNGFSSVEELLLPFDLEQGFLRGAGVAFAPGRPDWSYEAPGEFFSPFISGASRLPNGNTLICSGAPGRVIEVTREGEIVWEYLNPHGGDVEPSSIGGRSPPQSLFRAPRISRDHPGLRGRL